MEPSKTETEKASLDFTFEAALPFSSSFDANAVAKALSGDAELRPEHVSREISVEGHVLKVAFKASEARLLKSAVGTFLSLAALASDTIDRFSLETKDQN